jgi:hypothetical protein
MPAGSSFLGIAFSAAVKRAEWTIGRYLFMYLRFTVSSFAQNAAINASLYLQLGCGLVDEFAWKLDVLLRFSICYPFSILAACISAAELR